MDDLLRLESQLNQRMDYLEQRMKLTFEAQDRAITKAETATERRFDGVNEFRKTLADQTATFIPRTEFNRTIETMKEAIDELKSYKDSNVGRSGGYNALWAFIAGGVALAISVITFFMK